MYYIFELCDSTVPDLIEVREERALVNAFIEVR